MYVDLPSASHSKVASAWKRRATDVQQRDRKSHIATGGWRDNTSRVYGLFLLAPIGRQGFVVGSIARIRDLVR